ncbi:outer membrane protein assembly factor BamB [Lipingzhangella halophila]|uniref:Outer membrane protein assembly factor BamB n=1 Tax=Lipingzhangella halophila TaxID=1783352 RepID=A0A7W7RKD6_9ACTN|nr:PQQ-binding-like beta-propeller repeat protein [Lipingzhangella halophila]MBB4933173.1 outer membrane protein assembly factor BamB [Lipingzhangella halophila]
MRKVGICAVVGILSAATAGCDTGSEPDAPQYEASPISPDKLVTCGDDCDEPGTLRWSLPLDGQYFVTHEYGDSPSPLVNIASHSSVAIAEDLSSSTGIVAGDGTVYYAEDDLLRAVDADSGELHWQQVIGPDIPKTIEGISFTDSGILLEAVKAREEESRLYLVDPASGETIRTVGDSVTVDHVVRAGDDHVLVALQGDGDGYARLDLESGSEEWSASLDDQNVHSHNVTSEIIHSMEYSRPDDPEKGGDDLRTIHRFDLETGDTLPPVELAETAGGNVLDTWVTETGEIVLTSEECEQESDLPPGCGIETMRVADAETGEFLWKDEGKVRFGSAEPWDGATLLYVEEKEGLRAVDARTGETVTEDAFGEATAPINHYDARARHPDAADTPDSEDPLRTVTLQAPYQEELEWDGTSAGAEALGSARTADGEPIAVLQGCAPDGLLPERADAPSPGLECAEPRLFALNY